MGMKLKGIQMPAPTAADETARVCVLVTESYEYNRMLCRVFANYGALIEHLHKRIREIDPTIPERDPGEELYIAHMHQDYLRFRERYHAGEIKTPEYHYIYEHMPINE